MRRPFVAGNWKMNLTRAESVALAGQVVSSVNDDCDVAVCAPFVYLDAVSTAVKGSHVRLGAQNCYHEEDGAYTGEISTKMLQDLGTTYVILGHSERRHILGESNRDVNRKLVAVLNAGLVPIVCVGELLAQREAGQTIAVVKEQFLGSFDNITAEQMSHCVIAYEPVWAIGTGKVASPDQAEKVHADLRSIIAEAYSQNVADSIRIQYGGSVKPNNAKALLSQPNIDGALVGGASLNADDFVSIIQAAC